MSEAPAKAITLRPETPEDIPFLRRLYASTREEELAPVPWTPEEKWAFLESQFELQRTHYYAHYAGASFDVVELNGLPVGRVYVYRTAGELRLMDIALLREYQGRGIGKALMTSVLDEASRNGLVVTLHVEENNPARLWYERLGYEKVEERGIYWFMRWRPTG